MTCRFNSIFVIDKVFYKAIAVVGVGRPCRHDCIDGNMYATTTVLLFIVIVKSSGQ